MSTSQTIIRTYRDSDYDSVASLWTRVFPDDPPWNDPAQLILQKRRTQPELFWVAEDHGQIIGTVLAGYDGVRGWIYHLAVDPEKRRKGTARRLMQIAEDTLESLGCPKINLQVRVANMGVVEFYKTLGYDIEERVQMGKPIGSYRRRD